MTCAHAAELFVQVAGTSLRRAAIAILHPQVVVYKFRLRSFDYVQSDEHGDGNDVLQRASEQPPSTTSTPYNPFNLPPPNPIQPLQTSPPPTANCAQRHHCTWSTSSAVSAVKKPSLPCPRLLSPTGRYQLVANW